MKALQLISPGRPLEERELSVPAAGDGDLLVHIRAAGICHSDAHYRAGRSPVGHTPITPGHEIAGVVEKAGKYVSGFRPGDRVCLHYLVTCGSCGPCIAGHEQFCERGSMIGRHADGGYAEYIVVPERNAILLPDEVPFEQGAVMMCSTVTAYHALVKSRIRPGETLAVFGLGGLGMSAVQLGRAFGAVAVYGIDISASKLRMAEEFGAVPIDGRSGDAAELVRSATGGGGVDVALELVGTPRTITQAVASLAPMGRAVVAGISPEAVPVDTYRQLIGREAEIIGSNDHKKSEIVTLLEFARRGMLRLDGVVSHRVALATGPVNDTLDALERGTDSVRTVIVPATDDSP